MVTYSFYYIMSVYKSCSLSFKIKKNIVREEKEIFLKHFTKLIREYANYDLQNNDSKNVPSQYRLGFCDFSKNFIFHRSMCPRLSTYHVFFQILF